MADGTAPESHVREETSAPPELGPLLAAEPRATLFLHPSWLLALHHAYPRLHPLWLVLREGGAVVGVLPLAEISPRGLREVVSLPFGTHGGPIFAPEATPEGRRALLAAFRRRVGSRRTVRQEMTLFDPPPVLAEDARALSFPTPLVDRTFVLDLRGGEAGIQKRYEPRLRHSTRRAERAGVRVRLVPPAAGLPVFHALYAEQAGDWPLVWAHSLPALRRLVEALGEGARVWVADRAGTPVCAQIALYGAGGDVHLWLSGAAPAARPIDAFHLLQHEVALEAARCGFATYHLGTSMGKRGVEDFKRSFGADERPVWRYFRQPGWLGLYQRIRWSPWMARFGRAPRAG